MLRLLVVLSLLFVVPIALAGPPQGSKEAIRAAKKLVRQAKKLKRKGEWGEAAKLLSQAETLHLTWEIPWELAEGHAETGSHELAWRALGRCVDYGVPEKKQSKFDEFFGEVEGKLYEDHAYIVLEGVPSHAEVRINGAHWLPPYSKWVKRSFSLIQVNHGDFLAHKVNWHHLPGKRHHKSITMVSKSAWGSAKIVGTPKGATVMVAGTKIGALPSAQTELMEPGKYPVQVSLEPDWKPYQSTVTVKAGDVTRHEVTLEPTQSDFAKAIASPTLWGWTAVGVGGASLITGIALLGHSASLQGQAEDLNAGHSSGYLDYEKQYAELTEPIGGFTTGGWVLLGLGLALGGTGAALLVVFSDDEETSKSIEIMPGPTSLSARMRF